MASNDTDMSSTIDPARRTQTRSGKASTSSRICVENSRVRSGSRADDHALPHRQPGSGTRIGAGASERPHEGRLARTVRPQEGDPVPRGDREAPGCEAEGGEGDSEARSLLTGAQHEPPEIVPHDAPPVLDDTETQGSREDPGDALLHPACES